LSAHYLGNTFGQPAETALALSHLIFSGTLDRHPGLRLLAAHGGGFLPTYMGRSDHAWSERPDARGCARAPSSYLRRIWFDALVYTPQALRHLVEAAGADRVVLGTDYPFDMGVTDPVERAAAVGLPAADVTAILSGNARTLLSLPAA
jgi:aminocarboxymuconate-semialdehyde decarboxylase